MLINLIKLRIISRFVVIVIAVMVVGCNDIKKRKSMQLDRGGSEESIELEHYRGILDLKGTYFGVIPCADCEGVRVTVHLDEDFTYRLKLIYLGEGAQGVTLSGKFTRDEGGKMICLDNHAQYQFIVSNNSLIMLDSLGERVNGDIGAEYILEKIGD